MAKRKTKKKLEKISSDDSDIKVKKSSLVPQSRIGDSYISLALGVIVIVAISAVFFVFIKGNNFGVDTVPPDETINLSQEIEVRKYVLLEDEGLWDVAVKFYGDGFKWVIIADANNLTENPDLVSPGIELIIPNITE